MSKEYKKALLHLDVLLLKLWYFYSTDSACVIKWYKSSPLFFVIQFGEFWLLFLCIWVLTQFFVSSLFQYRESWPKCCWSKPKRQWIEILLWSRGMSTLVIGRSSVRSIFLPLCTCTRPFARYHIDTAKLQLIQYECGTVSWVPIQTESCPVWGRGTPLPPLSFYFLIFSPFYFFLSFIGFTYFLLLSIPSLSTRIVPLLFQAGGRRRRPNLGLVCCVSVICVICIP